MDLRKEIEKLAIWYIPVSIAMILATSAYSSYFRHIASGEGATVGSTIAFFAGIPALIQMADNIVVGIWLFFLARREGARPMLWLLFGLFAHLFAAVIYIALRLYEAQAFNKQPKPTP